MSSGAPDARSLLVTGTAGFIGRSLGDLLAGRGWSVVGLDRRAHDMGLAEVMVTDVTDPDVLARISDGDFAGVVHNAGISNTLELKPASPRAAPGSWAPDARAGPFPELWAHLPRPPIGLAQRFQRCPGRRRGHR